MTLAMIQLAILEGSRRVRRSSCLLLGSALGGYLTYLKIILGESIGQRPLLMLSVLLFLAGIQLFCFGLLGEMMMRTYHESQNRPIYRVRSVVGRGE